MNLLTEPTTLVAFAILCLAAVQLLRLVPEDDRKKLGALLGIWTFVIVGVLAPLVLVLVFAWMVSLLEKLTG